MQHWHETRSRGVNGIMVAETPRCNGASRCSVINMLRSLHQDSWFTLRTGSTRLYTKLGGRQGCKNGLVVVQLELRMCSSCASQRDTKLVWSATMPAPQFHGSGAQEFAGSPSEVVHVDHLCLTPATKRSPDLLNLVSQVAAALLHVFPFACKSTSVWAKLKRPCV